jgi:hypothetical protein
MGPLKEIKKKNIQHSTSIDEKIKKKEIYIYQNLKTYNWRSIPSQRITS